ncbi:uncharacterized protein TRAVEDRAFT_137347, partial [Trametes versicolor FP-101664 SS1]
QVFGVTCDNAESNTTMLKEMHVLVPKSHGELVRVRCFGHVLNLVVKVSAPVQCVFFADIFHIGYSLAVREAQASSRRQCHTNWL